MGKLVHVDEIDIIRPVLADGSTPEGPPTMIDVGANHGATLLPFARAGWRVHAFEPDPVNRQALEKTVADLPHVSIDPRALSNREETAVPFFRSEEVAGISSLSKFHSTHEQTDTVEMTTFSAYAAEQDIQAARFLKVDAEGFDLFVLQGVPWERFRPTVVLCEFENAKTEPLGYRFEDMADFLVDQGYQVLVSEWYPIQRYGGPHRWRCFNRYPCPLEDESAWGNLIASCDNEVFDRLVAQAGRITTKWQLLGLVSRFRQMLSV